MDSIKTVLVESEFAKVINKEQGGIKAQGFK